MKQVVWNELDEKAKKESLKRPGFSQDSAVIERVSAIIKDVRDNGDSALNSYTKKFDGADLKSSRAPQCPGDLDPEVCSAIKTAYKNITRFHEEQGYKSYSVEVMNGVVCKRVSRPIDRVGLYIPGGTAPLLSTAMMIGIPAQIAGCSEVVFCTPCNKDGEVNPYILYVAKLCGIEKVFRAGGAQAVAAMAYGTETIPKVDKIMGPGNAYVTEAKIQVAKDPFGAAIDMPAGPSEVCVVADEASDPVIVAADLLSQAEHDPISQAVLVCMSREKSEAVIKEVERQIEDLPRREIASSAIENSVSIIVADMDQAVEISNMYAPEHLILCFEGAEKYVDDVKTAGSVFVGPWASESAGDYASGTNHVLPTYGYARAYSGLSLEAFQRSMTVQSISRDGLLEIGPVIEKLAGVEGLDAHARAVSLRLEKINA